MDNGVTKREFLIVSKAQRRLWISIAFFVVILSGIGTWICFSCKNQDQSLGTYDDPEVAFKETQKALLVLSTYLNSGIESVQYVEEYNKSKDLIFKEP